MKKTGQGIAVSPAPTVPTPAFSSCGNRAETEDLFEAFRTVDPGVVPAAATGPASSAASAEFRLPEDMKREERT